MATITATIIRTKMAGIPCCSYDVYVEKHQKQYEPKSFGTYATVCILDGKRYYRLDDILRTPELDQLPALTTERLNAFRKMRRVADRLALKLAKRAFDELKPLSKLPTLWGEWDAPSAKCKIKFTLDDRYVA